MTVTAPDFNSLGEEEKRLVAERLLRIEQSGWKPFWCSRHDCDGMPHQLVDADGAGLWVDQSEASGPNGEPVGKVVEFEDGARLRPVLDFKWAHNHARSDQRLPPWKKRWTLFIMSGRGSGKTRTGIEFVTIHARKGLDGAIVGRRGNELVNTHVAEILKHAHPEFKPEYFASKDILVWPNGATTFLFSAERPENIRSVNLSYCWFDEAAWMDEVEAAWMNAKFATRVKSPGNPIHHLITSTPAGTPWVIKMEDDEDVEVRRVSTYANKANLDEDYLRDLEKEYEGTRKGLQELHGVVLRDVEGALWNDDMFTHLRLNAAEFADLVDSMDDRVLAVDPAGSKGPRSDAHGIIGAGVQHTDENGNPMAASQFYVLGRATIKGTPLERSERVFKAARLMRVNRIIVEKNFGGEDVKQGLQDYARLHPAEACNEDGEEYKIELVHASQSKEVRADPTVGKYEQGRVTHVTSPTAYGDLSALEQQQVGWVPKSRGGKMPSPNDIDALVWAIRGLESNVRFKTAGANSVDVMKRMKKKSMTNPVAPATDVTTEPREKVWERLPRPMPPSSGKPHTPPLLGQVKVPRAGIKVVRR